MPIEWSMWWRPFPSDLGTNQYYLIPELVVRFLLRMRVFLWWVACFFFVGAEKVSTLTLLELGPKRYGRSLSPPSCFRPNFLNESRCHIFCDVFFKQKPPTVPFSIFSDNLWSYAWPCCCHLTTNPTQKERASKRSSNMILHMCFWFDICLYITLYMMFETVICLLCKRRRYLYTKMYAARPRPPTLERHYG